MSREYSTNNKQGVVKNRAPAPIQISAEQILREAADRQDPHVLDPITKIHDAEEYQSYLASRRKHFEDNIRYRREHIGTWVKYARFEEDNKEYERARSVFERALEVDHRSAELWLRYAELEMRSEFVRRARNLLDRAVSILPRVDFLWYKYAYMEETVGNWERVREVFERWMAWHPDEGVWLSYARFEVRASNALNTKKDPNTRVNVRRATEVMKRYVNEYPCAKSFLKLAKWAEYETRDVHLARRVYEAALGELEPEEVRQAKVFAQFAAFEERRGEYERARVIYRHAIELLQLDQLSELTLPAHGGVSGESNDVDVHIYNGVQQTHERELVEGDITEGEKHRREELYKAYVVFEKKHGKKEGIERVVLTRQRTEYKKRIDADPFDYDAWFEYAKLEEDNNGEDGITVRGLYERAVANVPPLYEKKYWKRYIYLWIYYALYEETIMADLDRAAKVYRACLSLIPHYKFGFAKIWIYAAKLHVRRRDLESMRKLLGRAIGLCGKEKIFVEYIALELALGEIDRCRSLYTSYLKVMPHNYRVWVNYIDLERSLGETERCRALYELAVSQTRLDMPEMLWKGYIDFEIEEGEQEKARKLYEQLLNRTEHVKVWISYAKFEGSMIGQGFDMARSVFERAYQSLQVQGLKEERVLLLNAWKSFEKANGNNLTVSRVEKMMPHRIKRKQMHFDQNTNKQLECEEYIDYHFPDDLGSVSSNIKILEMAAKWKQLQTNREQDMGFTSDNESRNENN